MKDRFRLATTAIFVLQEAVARAEGDADLIMRAAVDHSLQAFPQAEGAILELIEDGELICKATSGISAAMLDERVSLTESLSSFSIASSNVEICNDTERDPRVDADACRRARARSVITVPLPSQKKVIGVLNIVASTSNAFGEDDVEIARTLMAPVAFGLAISSTERTQRVLEATFEQAAVGIAHVDVWGNFLRVNRRFCEIAGFEAAELMSGGFQQITHSDDLDADLTLFNALLRGEIPSYAIEKRYIRKSGEIVWINLTVSLVRFANGEPDFFVAVIEDISDRKKAEEMAMFDPLTGLPNRRNLRVKLDAALADAALHDETVCVGFIDLDGFKSVNDRFGHAEGDRCLMAVADLLGNALRRSDVVGRLGGDEFLLILERSSPAEFEGLKARLNATLAEMAKANDWRIGMSVGAVFSSPGQRFTPAEILEAADRLMYSEKQKGRPSTVQTSTPEIIIDQIPDVGAGDQPRQTAPRG